MSIDKQKWYVQEEIAERPKRVRITVRDTKSKRLIATLPEARLDEESKIAVIREEARRLALVPELTFMLEWFVYAAETRGESKYADGKLYRKAKKNAYDLLGRVKGLK